MTPKTAVAVIAFVAFNLPVAFVMLGLPWLADLKKAMKEKDALGAGADGVSYSRVTGLIGAVALTGFFWAVGDLLLYDAFTQPAAIATVMNGLGRFFLVGAALFAPYAFNQMRAALGALGPGAAAGVAAAAAAQARAGQSAAQIGAGGASGPAPTRLVIANLSASIDDQTLAAAVAAIGAQVSGEFAQAWGAGVSATLSAQRIATTEYGLAPIATASDAVIYFGDRVADPTYGVAGAYGYHTTNNAGKPYGFVYLDICQQYGLAWSCILSHEVLELLADPYLQNTRPGPAPAGSAYAGQTVSYGLEICDPVMGDVYPAADGTSLSNFVTPSYFVAGSDPTTTNYLGHPLAPFATTAGGYLQYATADKSHTIDGRDVGAAQIEARRRLGPWRRNARRAAELAPPPRTAAPTRRRKRDASFAGPQSLAR